MRQSSSTRGNPYKIFKCRASCTTQSEFFAERVVNIWNALPLNVLDFSSLIVFKRSIERSICLHSVQLHRLFSHKAALTFSFISSTWLCFIVFVFVVYRYCIWLAYLILFNSFLLTNRKSHVSFWLTPRLMTLADLELKVKFCRNFARLCDFGRQQRLNEWR